MLRIDRFLGPNFYLSGAVHSAVTGAAGGYTAALVGAGWKQPVFGRLHIGAELLGGASGGGGVDSRGSLVQPMAYLGCQLTPSLGLRLGAGRVKALHGPLSSTVADLTLVISYGISAGN